MVDLSKGEREFLASVKPLITAYLDFCKKNGIEPGAGSYILSESGRIFHGIPFDVARCIHGEENAIGAMLTEEGIYAKFSIILIVGSPVDIIMPCGMCRVAINFYGVRHVSVLCANQTMTLVKKFSIDELYPFPYQDEYESSH